MKEFKRTKINYHELRKAGFYGHPVMLDLMVFLLLNASLDGKVTTTIEQIQATTLSYCIEQIENVIIEAIGLSHVSVNDAVIVSLKGELQNGFTFIIANFKTLTRYE